MTAGRIFFLVIAVAADGTVHPATKLPASGLRLVELCVRHPFAEMIAGLVPMHDPRIRYETGAAGFRATFDGPAGQKVLT